MAGTSFCPTQGKTFKLSLKGNHEKAPFYEKRAQKKLFSLVTKSWITSTKFFLLPPMLWFISQDKTSLI